MERKEVGTIKASFICVSEYCASDMESSVGVLGPEVRVLGEELNHAVIKRLFSGGGVE